jgi:hypothetical protein
VSLSEILRGLGRVWRLWSWFWFRPVTASGLGFMRILLGLMLVMTTLDVMPDLEVLVGPHGAHSASAASKGLRLTRWTWFDHVDSMGAVYAIQAAALLANILFMIGFRSRTMGFLSVLAHVALYQRNSWFMNGGDRLVREFALYICLVPCGAAMSMDAWLDRRRAAKRGEGPSSPLIPILGLRLVQLQVCVVYLSTGLDKWATQSWQGGTALYYSLSTEGYQRAAWIVEPLTTSDWGQDLLRVGTAITLYWEVGFVLMILWRPTRWLALGMGVLIHIGIHITLMVGFFSSVSVWAYLSLLPYDWVERLQQWREVRRRSGSARSSPREE